MTDRSKSTANPQSRIPQIAARLSERYGDPRLHNKNDALDELVFIILSAKTTERSYLRTYDALHSRFPDWFDILDAPPVEVGALLASGGLATKKERQIRAVLQRLRDLGVSDLAGRLGRLDDKAAEKFLEELPGIGRKSARCILMYSFGREVFPVDTHVARVLSRLGVFQRRRLTDAVQDRIQSLVSPEFRSSLHVSLVAHGRAICKPFNPDCASCCIRDLCKYPPRAGRRALRLRILLQRT
jgi:endonuclease III